MKYTVRKAKVKDVRSIIHLLSEDTTEFQYQAAKLLVVDENGDSIGDAIDELDFADYTALTPDLMEAMGFGEDSGE